MVSQYDGVVETVLALAKIKKMIPIQEAYRALVKNRLEMALGEHMSVTKLLASLEARGLVSVVGDSDYRITHAGKLHLRELQASDLAASRLEH